MKDSYMDNPDNGYLDFEAYERAKEPHTRQKAYYWSTAIGLQKVDGLDSPTTTPTNSGNQFVTDNDIPVKSIC